MGSHDLGELPTWTRDMLGGVGSHIAALEDKYNITSPIASSGEVSATFEESLSFFAREEMSPEIPICRTSPNCGPMVG